ncbi:MAG: flagellar hook-length control protein FliK [Rubricella sp.]
MTGGAPAPAEAADREPLRAADAEPIPERASHDRARQEVPDPRVPIPLAHGTPVDEHGRGVPTAPGGTVDVVAVSEHQAEAPRPGATAAQADRPTQPAPGPAPQIAHAIAITQPGQDRIELRLDPPELGTVTIELEHGDQGLRAAITVERTETLELMRRLAEDLRQDLEDSGFAGASLHFSQRDRENGTSHGHGSESRAVPPRDDTGRDPAQRLIALPPGRIDIRV